MMGFAIIKTLILVFGLLSGLRISSFNNQNRVFEKKIFEKLMLIIGILTFLVLFFSKINLFAHLFIVFLMMFVITVTIFVTRLRREKEFRQEFVEFMDRIILQMRTGRGFRHSFELSNRLTAYQSQQKIQKIFDCIMFDAKLTQNDPFVLEIYHHFKEIERSSLKSIERLVAFRKKLRTEDDFRRRSGVLVRQSRIQVVFLSILYACLLLFISFQFPVLQYWKVYLSSFGFFFSGLIMFFVIIRRKIWRI